MCRPDHVRHLRHDFVVRTGDVLVAGVLAQRPEATKPLAMRSVSLLRIDFVTRQLLFNELIVGRVFIEALDHVVTEAVGIGAVGVVFIAVGFGETDDIEPVTRPLFAVARARPAGGRQRAPTLAGDVSFRKASISSGVGGTP